jgi:hypothetical protein
MIYLDTVSRWTTRAIRARFAPRVFEQLNAVQMEHLGHIAKVTISRKPGRPFRLVCPRCSVETSTVGCVPGKGWGCASCFKWISRGRQQFIPEEQRTTHHGRAYTNTYWAWATMIQHCYNPKHPDYSRYGGRGTTVEPEWRGRGGFLRFYATLGDCPEGKWLGRMDTRLSYTYENTQWMSPRVLAIYTWANRVRKPKPPKLPRKNLSPASTITVGTPFGKWTVVEVLGKTIDKGRLSMCLWIRRSCEWRHTDRWQQHPVRPLWA